MDTNRKKNVQKEVRNEKEWKDYIKKQHIIVFVSTILWGIAAHGYMFFNKLSWHDEIKHLVDVGATYSSGRWFLGILSKFVQIGFGNVSVPWFNGLLSVLILAIAGVLLIELFQLKRNISCILLGGLMVVFPSWVSAYAYMYTVVYYAFAVFLAILGIYLVWTVKKTWCGMIAGAVCFCLSLGIYQAYLPLTATVLVIAFLNDILVKPESSFKEHFLKGIMGVFTLASGLVLYFIINNIILSVKHISLTDYQNLNQMGHTNIKVLVNGIASAWKEFIVPVRGGMADMYMQSVRTAYYVVLILTAGFLIWHMVQCWKKNYTAAFLLLAGVLCFPIGVNLLCLMGDMQIVYGIMLYAKVMVFILPLVLAERIEVDAGKVRRYCVLFLSFLLVYVGVFYTHYANACYLQATFYQEEVISWMNTLIARIQSQDGYVRELPIAYLNEDESSHLPPSAAPLTATIPGIEMLPYMGNNFFGWREGLLRWCGFQHEEITDTSEIESWQEVQDMPSYPASGSVRIINDTIIVKF